MSGIHDPAFKAWLRRKPKPNRVRATCEDGPDRVVAINARTGASFWNDTIDTLASLRVVRVEALDAEGNVLRSRDVSPDDDQEEEQEEEQEQEAPAPLAAKPTTTDATLIQFAKLLSEAYRNGADAQRASSEVAFTRLVELTNVAFQRLDALERAYSRSFSERLRDAQSGAGAATAGGDELQQLLGAMLGGYVQSQAGKANGAASPAATAAPAGEGAS